MKTVHKPKRLRRLVQFSVFTVIFLFRLADPAHAVTLLWELDQLSDRESFVTYGVTKESATAPIGAGLAISSTLNQISFEWSQLSLNGGSTGFLRVVAKATDSGLLSEYSYLPFALPAGSATATPQVTPGTPVISPTPAGTAIVPTAQPSAQRTPGTSGPVGVPTIGRPTPHAGATPGRSGNEATSLHIGSAGSVTLISKGAHSDEIRSSVIATSSSTDTILGPILITPKGKSRSERTASWLTADDSGLNISIDGKPIDGLEGFSAAAVGPNGMFVQNKAGRLFWVAVTAKTAIATDLEEPAGLTCLAQRDGSFAPLVVVQSQTATVRAQRLAKRSIRQQLKVTGETTLLAAGLKAATALKSYRLVAIAGTPTEQTTWKNVKYPTITAAGSITVALAATKGRFVTATAKGMVTIASSTGSRSVKLPLGKKRALSAVQVSDNIVALYAAGSGSAAVYFVNLKSDEPVSSTVVDQGILSSGILTKGLVKIYQASKSQL